MDQETNTLRISPDELIERFWTELQLVKGIASEGLLREAWPTQPALLQVLNRAQWPVGSTVEMIFSALGAQHSQGETWLRTVFSQMSRYERKGGGLEIDADPVPLGLRPREGVEWGCGQQDCRECYELDRTIDEEEGEEETFIQVEYDLNYWGGDYSGMNSENAYVPYSLVQACGSVERAFEQHTGHDHAHIIHYSEGEYLTRQEFLETYGVELDEKEDAGDEDGRDA